MVREIVPGLLGALVTVTLLMAVGSYTRLRFVSLNIKNWLLSCLGLGLIIPLLILAVYPPNTDAALTSVARWLLWPSGIMLLAADRYTPFPSVVLVIATAAAANAILYCGLGLALWMTVALRRRTLPR